MATKLRDLISSIKSCKTASEERNVISQECAQIRTAFKDENNSYRSRCIAKLLFIHMLGYPTHFGQMECVKLIASSQYAEKRIGYLGLTQLLDENSEVLMLVTNSIKYDMQNSNQYISALALQAMGSIANLEMCRSLESTVKIVLNQNNAYTKKRAALCVMRIFRKTQDSTDLPSTVRHLLEQKNHGVIMAGCSIMLAMLEADPSCIREFQQLIPQLVRILKAAVNLSNMQAAEYDIGGIRDPFLQIRLMRILRLLAEDDAHASEEIGDVLAEIATNTTGKGNVDHAILYECARTIIFTKPTPGFLALAINVLGGFLKHKESNLRYVALCLLQHVVKVDVQAVQRHWGTIMECLGVSDNSIKRRALDVTTLLINGDNIKIITKALLNFLLDSDGEFRVDIVSKICVSLDRFAPTREWHINTLIKVMCLAGNYVQEEVRDSFVNLVLTSPELRSLAVFKLFYSLRENLTQEALVQVAVWCIGEFGDLLTSPQHSDDEDADVFKPVSSKEVLDLLEAVEQRSVSVAKVQSTHEFIITALIKLSVRYPNELNRIQKMLKKYECDKSIEIQQRASEYGILLDENWADARPALLERIPVTESLKALYQKRKALPQERQTHPAVKVEKDKKVDLLEMEFDTSAPVKTTEKKDGQWNDNMLDELFGSLSVDTPTPNTSNAASNAVPTNVADKAKKNKENAEMPPLQGLFDDLIFGETPAPPSPKTTPKTIFDEDGVRIIFLVNKSAEKPNEYAITAQLTNSCDAVLSKAALEVAVPKYITIKMFPASSSELLPNNMNTIEQKLTLCNQSNGEKAIIMRLRLSYLANKQEVVKLVNVSDLEVAT